MPRKQKSRRGDSNVQYVKPDYHSQNKNNAANIANEAKDDFSKQKKWKNKLRTSSDIYNRLIWDWEKLDIDLNNVWIGYTDYVLGNQEIKILEWTPIEKGGEIPFHHVVYFIYHFKIQDAKNNNRIVNKKIKLWDRETRTDRLFKNSGETPTQQKWNNLKKNYKIIANNNGDNNINNNINNSSVNLNLNQNHNWNPNNNHNFNIHNNEEKMKQENKSEEKEKEKDMSSIINGNQNRRVIMKADEEYYNNIQFLRHYSNKVTQLGLKSILSNNANNSMIKYFPRYPVTNDGFVESYNIENSNEWLAVLSKYGFVVLKDVFSNVQCNATINELLNEFYHMAIENSQYDSGKRFKNCKSNKISRINPNGQFYDTWEDCNFPSPGFKYLNKFRPPLNYQSLYNRCNDKMYNIWKTVYNGNKKLNVSIDNIGCYRGTVFKQTQGNTNMNNNINNGNFEERKEWRASLNPHWDINPWDYSNDIEINGNYRGQHIYQACVALTDNHVLDGTHIALPGCINFLKQWCEINKHLKRNKPSYKADIMKESMIKYMQPIPLRKGEMLIWDYGQLHATSSNYSSNMRFVQYIRYYPSMKTFIDRDHYGCQQICDKHSIDLKAILRNIKCFVDKNGRLDDTVVKIFGLRKWL